MMHKLAFVASTFVFAIIAPMSLQANAEAYDEDNCWANYRYSCNTIGQGGLEAHNSQYWVQVKGGRGLYLTVRDRDHNNDVVYSGYGTGDWVTIYNLYGENYVLYVSGVGSGGRGWIRNYT